MERYWSTKKGSHSPKSIVSLVCGRCGREFTRPKWYQDRLTKLNKGKGFFCSKHCATLFHNTSEETKRRISEAQKGVSVLSRGRKGKIIPPEVREKIRKSKLGKPSIVDWEIVNTALETLGVKKAAITKGLVPDAIFVKDGLLTALEVEKKKYEFDIREKMLKYDNRTDYDKVIIMWYDPKGNYLKQWVKYKGEWNLVTL